MPKGSKIPYPMNLQVYYVEEKIRKTDATKDETTLQESSSVDAEKHEGWLKEFHTAKMELKPSRSSAGPERAGKISNAGDTASTLNEAPSEGNQSTTQGTHAYDEKTKIAIKHLRKNVNAGDRFKRELEQTIALSNKNENTKGSKIELELESIMKTIGATTERLSAMEQIYRTPSNFNDVQLKEIAVLVDELKKDTKLAKEKDKGLKSWFKL